MDDPVNVEVVKGTKDWWLDIWILDLRISGRKTKVFVKLHNSFLL